MHVNEARRLGGLAGGPSKRYEVRHGTTARRGDADGTGDNNQGTSKEKQGPVPSVHFPVAIDHKRRLRSLSSVDRAGTGLGSPAHSLSLPSHA